MKPLRVSAAILCLGGVAAAANPEPRPWWDPARSAIERHLGRPYVWGACGSKSFDCSGFVWRIMMDNGVLFKRTTARKFYMMLPRIPKESQYTYGNIVFFDNLKHCGIVNERGSFYHSQLSKGTNLSPFNQFWRSKISGFRGVRAPAPAPAR
jgi:cell wall-associated NlpC family hydrolase